MATMNICDSTQKGTHKRTSKDIMQQKKMFGWEKIATYGFDIIVILGGGNNHNLLNDYVILE